MAKKKPKNRQSTEKQRVVHPPSASRIVAEAKKIQVETEQKKVDGSFHLRLTVINSGAKIIHAIIRGATVVGVAWCVFLTFDRLAGRQTDAKIIFDLSFMANKYASQFIFSLFGVGGCGYGWSQRRLYKQTAERLKRMKWLEEQIDSNRTSSELRDGWQSNKEDQ